MTNRWSRRVATRVRLVVALAVGLLITAVLSVSVGVGIAAAADGGAVKVDTVAELKAAVANGASRIVVSPGNYRIRAPIDLVDVKLSGQGDGVKFINDFDPNPPPSCTTGMLVVAGTVVIENIAFKGGGCGYLRSADAGQGIDRNKITVRGSRFGKDGSFAWFNVFLGNISADGSNTQRPSWDITFSHNHVQGGFAGLLIGNALGDAPDARVTAMVAQNEFRDSEDGLLVFGSLSGSKGTVKGTSKDNLYKGMGLYGVNLEGGVDNLFDPGSKGGSFGTVVWTSIDERFVDNTFGIAAWGGHRHGNIFGPSKGNSVRIEIVSPTFKNSGLRDVDILGASAYDTLPTNAKDATTFGAGNTVRLTLVQADFQTGPGRVWIKNQDTDDVNSGRFDEPVPNMAPNPSYRNRVTITGTRSAFERTNRGVNRGLRRIPAAYFIGGE